MEAVFVNLGDNLPHLDSNEQRSDASKHHRLVEQAVLCEAAGFDSFLVGEHHFNWLVFSQPVVTLGAIASQTSTIRLGTGVTLLTTQDPVVVAEQFTTLDVLSSGRAEIVVARGTHRATWQAMDRPPERAAEILEESMELLSRLLTEDDVHWKGEWRPQLDGITIRPRSIQQPIPLWCGSTSTIDLAARLGLPMIWGSAVVAPYADLIPLAERYREAWEQNGRDLADLRLGIGVHFHVARTSQEAKRRFRPIYEYYRRKFLTLESSGFKRLVPPVIHKQDDPLESIAFCGSPSEVVEKLALAKEALGLTRVIYTADIGSMSDSLVNEVIELAGSEVLPALR